MNTKTPALTFVADATLRVGPDSRREVVKIGLDLPDALTVLGGDFHPIAEHIARHWPRLDFEVTHAWFADADAMEALVRERIMRSRMAWEDER